MNQFFTGMVKASQMVYVLYTRLSSGLTFESYLSYFSMLPSSLRQENLRYLQWDDKFRNVAGKILLMKGICELGLEASELENIRYDEYKRPFLSSGIDFNIAHSGSYVLCAISKEIRVGIDIEEIRPVNFEDFVGVMTEAQWDRIKRHRRPLKAFYSYWSMKESVMKADGRGMEIPLDTISITGNSVTCGQHEWFLKKLDINDGYAAWLATNCNKTTIALKYIHF
ncbi:MAG: 4'-phosphopantetheinyl transferase superfamily protein [Chitinophagaceae bacterium]